MTSRPLPVLLGFQSGAAQVVGVLAEAPVMLRVVRVVNRSTGWYEAAACAKPSAAERA